MSGAEERYSLAGQNRSVACAFGQVDYSISYGVADLRVERPESNVPLTPETNTRIAAEQKWYNLTGRVVGVKVEGDGDITLVLKDADGKKAGSVGAEIPVGPTWCELRQTVFAWTTQSFPFSFKESQKLEIREPHIITVTGKAFFDVQHVSADNSNRRTKPKKYAVWEIHPVMALHVDQ